MAIKDETALDWSTSLLGFITPLLLVASISTLLLTNAPLPASRLSWLNKLFANVRRFRIMDAEHGVAIQKKNQFGVGQPDFNLMSIWLILIPGMLLFCTYIHHTLEHARDPETLPEGVTAKQRSVEYVSYTAGWAGTVLLSFFLIPVSRHSVLLVAMNWSPVHALRVHIWAGYVAFFLIFIHAILIVGVWFKWAPGAIYEEIFPPKDCWSGEYTEESRCSWKFYNFTGVIAMIFYTILWASSFNWFRRKWYRLFYILHVVFGTLTLLASVWHFEFIGLYLLPSILYYLASTMPTLVQALASRFRGGVQIVQVVALDNAGDCIEVRVSLDPSAEANLSNSHPSKFIKLCAPGISSVWHPFTVYNHPNDPTTMRMMIRPIGPFTMKLRSSLVDVDRRPVTLIDGFYRGADHCQQAMMTHDHVSIVAGGVALTPFLSMIFAILKELPSARSKASDNVVAIRSMTLMWSCREHGLLSFIQQNYLETMVRLAGGIEDFDFKIKIFYTGPKIENVTPNLDNEEDEVLTEQPYDKVDDLAQNVVPPPGDEITSNMEMLQKVNHTIITYNGENPGSGNSAGHAMELGRMMPARFSRMIWNVPYFIAFTSSVWLGFHFMFFPYDYVSLGTYRENSEEAYITMLVIAFFFGFGIVIECCVLMFRKHWPAPCTDDGTVASTSQVQDKLGQTNEETTTQFNTSSDEQFEEKKEATNVKFNDSFQYVVGRPNSEDMLSDACRANAPGLYVCGPTGMVQTLRAAAALENSPYGLLTRYAIYEESFEM